MTRAHVHGPTDTPLIEKTIGAFFDEVTAAEGEATALISRHQGARLTYGALRAQVDALAASLMALGLSPGDRIGIWAPNCVEWVLTQFATAKAGLILVNINPAYRVTELSYALNKVGCRALITAPAFKTSDYIGMLTELAPELLDDHRALNAARLPSLDYVIRLGAHRSPGFLNFDDLLAPPSTEALAALQELGETLSPRDPINIQFTSGTTGSPKGATLTHRNILNNGFFCGEALALKPGEGVCIPVPLYHCFGMVIGNLACLTHAATMVFPSAAFEPLATLETVAEERCAALYGVPTMFIAMLDAAEGGAFDLSSLRTGVMAGSACPIEVMRRVVSELNCPEITICYGMTETSPVSFQSALDDPLERRVTTVGRIHPHVEVKLIDETGAAVKRGEMGEFCAKGYLVMQGYWGDEEKTRASIDADGFMHSGDLAVIDDEGFCNIVGRTKDMVIRGGENIYPREVEEFLYSHPKISDVQVVGVPDDKYGEALCACVIPSDPSLTAEEVRAYCKDQIAHYKIPAYVEFVDEFPLTVTGKVQKYLMRAAMAEKLGLVAAETA